MQIQDFDASSVPPQQGFDTHPVGMFDFQISNTYIKMTKDNQGAMFVVEFTSPMGRVESRYNLWNNNTTAVEIARKELSALCHATKIFRASFPKNPDGSPIMDRAGAELRGGRGRMEIVPQTDKQGNPTGYVEIKKVYDTQGNEPGKQGSAPQPQQGWGGQQPQQPQQQQPMQQPMQQQGNGGWSAPQPPQQPQPPNNIQGPAWGAPQGQPQQGQPQAQPNGPAPWNK